MSGRPFSFPGNLVYVLILIALISALAGCAPNIPNNMMSPEDLQTCDDLGAKMRKGYSEVSEPSSHTKPYQVTPGEVNITSPEYGSILPYGTPLVIKFTQPPADAGVLYRNYRVIVTTLTNSPYYWPGNTYAVVTQPPNDIQVTWTPPGSGKYLIMVLLANLETIEMLNGNTDYMSEQLAAKSMMMEDFDIDSGAFSTAFTCIQVALPTAGGAKTVGPVTMMPLQNITLPPTETRTATLTPTGTFTLTFTPSLTATFTPTLLPPKTKTPTSTPTNVPPTPVVDCSQYDERTCPLHFDVCYWEPGSTMPGVCKPK